jgi:outer membrane biosynthesis protein TonB
MTLFTAALLALELTSAPAGAASRDLAPLEELPKAPVEITVPERSPKPAGPAKAGANQATPPPKRAEVPLPPPPVLPASRPAPSPVPKPPPPAPDVVQPPPPGASLPSDAEILAAASGAIPDPRPGYALVEQKCGRCHSMEKALDATFAPGDWDGYLKRKLRRHGTGISEAQAAEIAKFLSAWAEQKAERR